MKRAALSALWAASVCGALAAGALVARRTPSESAPVGTPYSTKKDREEPADTSDLQAKFGDLRELIRAKEMEIGVLREKLDIIKSQLFPPLSPELEKELKERLEERKRAEAEKPQTQRRNVLQKKILQRRDKALREGGLTELLALLQSTDIEDQRTGFTVLDRLGSIEFDTERFRPYVLAALSNADTSVRKAAVDCVYVVCSHEEALQIAVRMVRDTDPEIRMWAALDLNGSGDPEHKDAAVRAITSLLQEGDLSIKQRLLTYLHHRLPEGMDDVMVKLLDEKGLEYKAEHLLHHREATIREPVVRRLSEMYEEGTSDERIMRYLNPDWIDLGAPDEDPRRRRDQPRLAEEARPIVREIYLRVARDSPSNGRRRQALDGLRKIGDRWAIPELQEIARSPDAEGIEDELAKTIEYLHGRREQEQWDGLLRPHF
jgi:hypothetical protein